MSKLIAVCGCTGAQGGAVVQALLTNSNFKIRGLTRRIDSDKANALREKGVEIVRADFDDKSTLEKAFEGCYGAYLVTNYWDKADVKVELQQGKDLADAVKKAGLKHVVWSTAEDTRKFKDDIPMMDTAKVPFFDMKAEIQIYMASIGLPVTNLYTSLYIDNFAGMFKFEAKPDDDGIYRFAMPMKDKKLGLVAVADIGKIVERVLEQGIMGDIGVVSQYLTGHEICQILSEGTGKKFEYVPVSADDYRKNVFILGNMFQFYEAHADEFAKKRPLDRVKSLFTPTTVKEWVQENKDNMFKC